MRNDLMTLFHTGQVEAITKSSGKAMAYMIGIL